jgi:type 1 fimbria pilin
MRKILAVVAAAAFVMALGAPAFAATETVKGQIVDQACYKMDKTNTGVDHKMPKGDTKDCAIGCAKAGRPLALLTADGKVYEIAGGLAADKNAKLIPHVAHTVEITGDVMDHGGSMMITADSLKMISK